MHQIIVVVLVLILLSYVVKYKHEDDMIVVVVVVSDLMVRESLEVIDELNLFIQNKQQQTSWTIARFTIMLTKTKFKQTEK